MKSIKIIENKSEIGAGTRGSSLGIDALKVASLKFKSDFFGRYENEEILDQNHLLFEENETPTAIRIAGIEKVYKSIATEVQKSLENNLFPLVLAADHASAGGTIAGIKMNYPNKRLGVVWIDAHGDLHSPYTSPTGNVHGMPLATALNEDNMPCKIKEVGAEAKKHWHTMKNLGDVAPKILPEDLIFYGVRDTEEPEEKLMERLGIRNFKVEECQRKGFETVIQEGLDLLSNCDIIYVSFDVDSMDSEKVSTGTGTPVPQGFMPEEVEQLILGFIESKKVVCFEMVEVNPTLDNKENLMAETAFKVLEKTTNHIEKFCLS